MTFVIFLLHFFGKQRSCGQLAFIPLFQDRRHLTAKVKLDLWLPVCLSVINVKQTLLSHRLCESRLTHSINLLTAQESRSAELADGTNVREDLNGQLSR